MNILIKNDSESSVSSNKQQEKLYSLLQKLSIKIMRSAQSVLKQQIVSSLSTKYEQLVSTEKNIVQFLEYFIFYMLKHIDQMQHDLPIEIARGDYEALEQSVQKAEAEIRRHIKIQQQLKIYMDSLQEKISEQQIQLAIEEQKYMQLFESVKLIDSEKKQLKRKLAQFEDQKQKVRSQQSNHSTINDQLYKGYYASRNTKANPKCRNVMDKYNQRIRKFSQKKNQSTVQVIDGNIQINLSNNIIVSKKSSYDQNFNKANPMSQDNSIRQLTKTVQMKQLIHIHEQRKNRKVPKYKTEFNEVIQKKQARSNSVFN